MQNSSFCKYFMVACIILFSLSCIDEITLDIDGAGFRSVIVDGRISNDDNTCIVKLFQSAELGVGNDNIFDPIGNASIQLLEDNVIIETFQEDPMELGVYRSDMIGVIGKEYAISITLPDGSTIESTSELMLDTVSVDTIIPYAVIEEALSDAGTFVTTEFGQIDVSTTFDESDPPYLRWRTEGEYQFIEQYPGALSLRTCYVPDLVDVNNVRIENAFEIEGNRIERKQLIKTRLDRRFGSIYCFHVFQYRTSKREYDYYKQVDQLVNIQGNIFDSPPASIQGNLVNTSNPESKVFGYFSVASRTNKRRFVDFNNMGTAVFTGCRSFGNLPDACFDCRVLKGSTTIKPAYWP